MNIWSLNVWEKYYLNNKDVRKGLRLKFDKDVDLEVKRSCKEFCCWLRKKYFFPMRIPIYVKSSKQIETSENILASALFFKPYNKYIEPYISVATGDYEENLAVWGKDDALAANLCSIAHELTHYFQWINEIELTTIGKERQATRYSKSILFEYSQTREHP